MHFLGEYHINVLVNGLPLDESPFITKVYDVKQIRVKDIPKGIIGKPVTFVGRYQNNVFFSVLRTFINYCYLFFSKNDCCLCNTDAYSLDK